jgi:hypothetical protein
MVSQLTGKPDVNDALTRLLKDFFQLKIESLQEQIKLYEEKYGMSYAEFDEACRNEIIEDPYSYEVEKDDWDWEAAVTELEDVMEYQQWLD